MPHKRASINANSKGTEKVDERYKDTTADASFVSEHNVKFYFHSYYLKAHREVWSLLASTCPQANKFTNISSASREMVRVASAHRFADDVAIPVAVAISNADAPRCSLRHRPHAPPVHHWIANQHSGL